MKRPLQNLTALFASDAASRGVGFLVTVYLARILGPAGFGLVSVGMALLGHLQLIASPGVQLVETRNTARPGGMDEERFGGVLALRFILSFLLFGIASAVLFIIPYGSVVRSVMLWSLASLFPLALATDWYLQGHERMGPVGAARFAGYCIYGVAAWVLVRSADHIALAPASFFLGALVTTTMLWWTTASLLVLPRVRWNPALWWQILKENFPVGGAVFAGQMVINLPPIVLAAVHSTADAGVYNAAMKLVFLLLIADRVLNALLLPALTRVRETKPADLQRMLMVITKMVVTAVAALILLGNLLAAWGIHLVFGSAYAGAEPVFRILLLYIGLTLVNSIATNALLAGGFERQYSRILILGSVVLVVAILVLTPLFGTIGTASGAVFGEFSTVVLMASQARKERLFPGSAIFAGPVIAGCVAGLTAWALWPVHTAVAAVAAGVLFIGLLLLFRVFRDEDIAYLKERLV